MIHSFRLYKVLLCTVIPAFLNAQDGAPDLSFASYGRFEVESDSVYYYSVQMALQTSGAIVQANSSDNDVLKVSVIRLDASGQQLFPVGAPGNGTTFVNPNNDDRDYLYVTRVIPEDKVMLVINTYNYNVFPPIDATLFVRLNEDGTLDDTFGQNGHSVFDFSAGDQEEYFTDGIALADGKFLAAGYLLDSNYIESVVLIRLNEDGSLDDTFGINGVWSLNPGGENHEANKLERLSDGKFILEGNYYDELGDAGIFFSRLNSDGTLDTAYGINGYITSTIIDNGVFYAYDMALDKDGLGLYIIGDGYDPSTGESKSLLTRFNLEGIMDNTFGQNGILEFEGGSESTYGQQVEVQTNGKILVGGSRYDPSNYFVARYESNGDTDLTFGNQGIVNSLDNISYASVDGLLLQDDGKILVSGSTDLASGMYSKFVMRLLCAGCSVNTNDLQEVLADVSLSPNPASEVVNLRFDIAEQMDFSIQLFSSEGKLCAILQSETTWSAGENQVSIVLPIGLPMGPYQLALVSGAGIKTIPLVIK